MVRVRVEGGGAWARGRASVCATVPHIHDRAWCIPRRRFDSQRLEAQVGQRTRSLSVQEAWRRRSIGTWATGCWWASTAPECPNRRCVTPRRDRRDSVMSVARPDQHDITSWRCIGGTRAREMRSQRSIRIRNEVDFRVRCSQTEVRLACVKRANLAAPADDVRSCAEV